MISGEQYTDEQLWVKHICQDENVQQLHLLTRKYQTMVRERQSDNLVKWMDDATATTIPAVLGFVKGIRQDYAAVLAALEFSWSNGQVEGQVNRLKLLKRQMYGRASFELLRARVLHSPTVHES